MMTCTVHVEHPAEYSLIRMGSLFYDWSAVVQP